ncbi:MAG: prolyl oligopeptidase family serine peptidase [Actinomycetota bacterium]
MARSSPSLRLHVLALLLGFVLVAAACGDDGDSTEDGQGSATGSQAAAEEATDTGGEEVEETTTTETAPTTTEDEPTTTTAQPDAETAAPVTGPGCAALTPGEVSLTLTAGGADHDVDILIPSAFAGEPLPTVLNWHGLGSNGSEQAAYSGYPALAEAEGFIVVHPTGVPALGDDRNSWELIDAQDPGRDDLAFAEALIDTLIEEWCADEERIFSTGMSNGGFFTARLVCEIPERLAGAISVAGIYHPPDCDPSEPVPFLAYHGTDDGVVPFDGSGESSLAEPGDAEAAEFFSMVMPDEFGEFAEDFGCGEPTTTDIGDTVIRYDYSGCEVPMSFFEVTGGGHTWPDSPLAPVLDVLGFHTTDVSATEDGWAFFAEVSGS